MPEGGAGRLADALLAMAARRVRLLTMIVLVGAVTLIAAHDASWTSIGVAGITTLAIVAGWLGIWFWLRVLRPSGERGGS